MRTDFEALLNDPDYRAWFARWWEADFSIDGCTQRNLDWRIGRSRTFEIDFAGRRWGPGRVPPHDLNGDFNDQFFQLDWFDWSDHFQRYRATGRRTFELDGAWFKRLDPDNGPDATVSAKLSFVLNDMVVSSSRVSVLRCRDIYIGGSLQLIDASLAERAIFTRAIIGKDVVIRHTAGAPVHLNRTRINGSVHAADGVSELDLSEADVKGGLNWTTAVQRLDAFKARIQGDAVLTSHPNASAIAQVRLRRTSFKAGLSLKDATLSELDLTSARLTGSLEAANCNLQLVTAPDLRIGRDFTQVSTSGGGCNLRDLRVSGQLEWRACHFGETAMTKAIIGGTTKIEGCRFTRFDAAQMEHAGEASYLRTTFSDAVTFNGARFRDRTSFRGAAFRGRASFLKCRFDGSTSFAADRKEAPGFVDGGSVFETVTFQTSCFTASPDLIWCVDFDGRQFEGASIFDGCRFAGSPRFFEVAFHEDASFRYTEFRPAPHPDLRDRWKAFQTHANVAVAWRATMNAWNKGQQQYEHAYRSLKLRMNEIGSAREERRFLSLELRARRARFDPEVRPLESLLSVTYDIVSEYGESIVRPLVWTVIVTLAAAVLYHTVAPSHVDWLQATEFAVRQIFKPFNVWADGGAALIPARPATWMEVLMNQRPQSLMLPLWIKLLASLQSLACLTLLFLSASAIRKRFRLT